MGFLRFESRAMPHVGAEAAQKPPPCKGNEDVQTHNSDIPILFMSLFSERHITIIFATQAASMFLSGWLVWLIFHSVASDATQMWLWVPQCKQQKIQMHLYCHTTKCRGSLDTVLCKYIHIICVQFQSRTHSHISRERDIHTMLAQSTLHLNAQPHLCNMFQLVADFMNGAAHTCAIESNSRGSWTPSKSASICAINGHTLLSWEHMAISYCTLLPIIM